MGKRYQRVYQIVFALNARGTLKRQTYSHIIHRNKNSSLCFVVWCSSAILDCIVGEPSFFDHRVRFFIQHFICKLNSIEPNIYT